MSNSVKELLGPRNKDFQSVLVPRNPRSQAETEAIAERLVEKFKSPEYKNLFLKVAWRLDDGTIDRHMASAFELGKNPRAYFIALVKREKTYYS